MLSHLFTRSVGSRPSRIRFCPRVEGLEGREVPAAFTWLGGDPMDPESWQGPEGETPWEGDDLYFDGTVSPASCDLGMTGVYFQSMHLINGYPGTVAWIGGQLDVLELTSGALATPDIAGLNTLDIYDTFTWTGGILNSTADHGLVTLYGGATATITPGADKTLVTGSSLNFGGSDGKDAVGTFNPGTVQFNNGADLNVFAFSRVDIKPTATVPVKFQNPDPNKVSQTNVQAGSTVTVTPTSTEGEFAGEKVPVNVAGGTFKVVNRAKVQLSGRVGGGQGAGSIEMSLGNIAIQNGSTVVADDNGMKLSGGVLTTLKLGDGPQDSANIKGTIVNSGADITPLADAPTRGFGGGVYFGGLNCTGDVTWTGGAYRPCIYGPQGGGEGTADTADLWYIIGKLTIGGSAKVGLVVVGANGNQQTPPAPAAGQRWLIIETTVGIAGGLPGLDPSINWASLDNENNVPAGQLPKMVLVET
jgi:hypothetical protein